MGKKLFAVALLLIGLVVVGSTVHAGFGFFKDLCEIVSPEHRQALDTHPVEVFVTLSPWANTSTFRAWLNGQDITGEFEPAEGGMRALVGPKNGLNYRLTGTRPPGIKTNLLVTLVQGPLKKKDLDTRVFFVEYEPVATTRDEVGVWFITGGSLYDVFEAMGYAVASDRLWQMETYRRSARGRLAEVFGSDQLGTDIFLRTVGYSDDELSAGFAALDKEAKLAIQGYVDGINRRIGEIAADPAQLPYEFLALDFFPEDWSVSDVLAWMSLLLRQFDCEALKDGQIKNASLLQHLNEYMAPFISDPEEARAIAAGMFNDLRWMEDPEALTYIPAATAQAARGAAPTALRAAPSAMAPSPPGPAEIANLGNAATVMEERLNSVIDNLKRISAWVKMGSYAWAVSGDKTADNNPIIYSGP
ncbi:MAG: penicillin acylase family protein, partial [Desulfomonilia bacterium]|nr:penicillin acylase family protein [Desulfomonilia bacterium]